MSKFCSNCGNQTEENSTFCPSCGSAIGGNVNQNTNNQNNNANNNVNLIGAKSKMAAGLLGIFLGSWGVHNFYLGDTKKGVLQIILTIVTCGIAGLWGFIEGILILCGSIKTDAAGNPLGE